MFCITKFCKIITDDGKDWYTGRKKKMEEKLMEKYGKIPELYKFRLLDDDGEIYAYGLSTTNDDDNAFNPLDYYMDSYGVTSIQYKNTENNKWEEL